MSWFVVEVVEVVEADGIFWRGSMNMFCKGGGVTPKII